MIKGGGDKVVDWIWRLCNIAFESGVMPEHWRSAVLFHFTKVKERDLSVRTVKCGWKIYAGIVDIVRRMTGGLIDDEQRGFRVGRWCVGQIFTVKQIDKKARDKKT